MLRAVTHPPICTHSGAALHLMGPSFINVWANIKGPIEMEMRPLRPCSRNAGTLTPLQTVMELQKRLVCNDHGPSFDCCWACVHSFISVPADVIQIRHLKVASS